MSKHSQSDTTPINGGKTSTVPRLSPAAVVAIVAAGIIAIVVIGTALSHLGVGSTSSTSTTTASSAPATTPLGCAPGNDGDCTDRALASRLCDVALAASPEQFGNPTSGIYTKWYGGPGLEVDSVYTAGSTGGVHWWCMNMPEHQFHNLALTSDEWHTLHTAGPGTQYVDDLLRGLHS